ncbi:lysis protein [Xenorhabdus mauleonii]|uniref:Lysis protein n=1 Tax=Xenorhabdus mauleonii TaxID=351675 RepID=A0A1I3X228_9GAMM|nr:lysis protein [Xenorhabdus mauleonii]PHM38191.1 lysis protein [Xenorhabdus mauleonii]SFK13633.1 prophage endopeptidase [Xenorhabdus mauleonii]
MRLNSRYFALGAFAVIAGLLWFYYSEYQQKAKDYDELETKFKRQVIAIKDQQERIKHLSEIDTTRLQELTNAKSKITQLSDDLRTYVKRVYVRAECPVPETASPSGVDGSRPARLEKDAEQDYVRLLGELETLEAQCLGLRDYVKTECLR